MARPMRPACRQESKKEGKSVTMWNASTDGHLPASLDQEPGMPRGRKGADSWGDSRAESALRPASSGPAKPSRQRSACQFGAPARDRPTFLPPNRAQPLAICLRLRIFPLRRPCDIEGRPFPAESKRGRRPAGAPAAPNAADSPCRSASALPEPPFAGEGYASFHAPNQPSGHGQRRRFSQHGRRSGPMRSPCNPHDKHALPSGRRGGQRTHFRPTRRQG